jgi:hypothetical protein
MSGALWARSLRGSDRGVESSRGGATVWNRPSHGRQNDEVHGAAGLRAHKAAGQTEADPFIPVIDRILFDDKSRPRKQQHTAKRIFGRLRDEYGFTGGLTIVKDYVSGWRQRAEEMFVPLEHPPGHAHVDFGEAIGVIGGVERKSTSSLLTCHTRTPASWSAAPPRPRKPSATATFGLSASLAAFRSLSFMTTLRSPWLAFLATGSGSGRAVSRSCNHTTSSGIGLAGLARAPTRAKSRGWSGYARRNFLVPLPVLESFVALNAYLVGCCRRRIADRLRGHNEMIAQRLERDLAALPRPPVASLRRLREGRDTSLFAVHWFATGSTTTRSRRHTVIATCRLRVCP